MQASDSDSGLSDIDTSRRLTNRPVHLTTDKIQSLVTSVAATSDGEDVGDLQAQLDREDRVNVVVSAIQQDAERVKLKPTVQDHGARAAFRKVAVHSWNWAGEDEDEVKEGGGWKAKVYQDIVGKSLCCCTLCPL